MSVPYVHAEGINHECCIASNTNKSRALCGRKISFRPVVPPVFPPAVHEVCEQRWRERGSYETYEATEYGWCPECGGDVPLTEGLIGAHKAWVRTRHGLTRSDVDCDGAGQQPLADEP